MSKMYPYSILINDKIYSPAIFKIQLGGTSRENDAWVTAAPLTVFDPRENRRQTSWDFARHFYSLDKKCQGKNAR